MTEKRAKVVTRDTTFRNFRVIFIGGSLLRRWLGIVNFKTFRDVVRTGMKGYNSRQERDLGMSRHRFYIFLFLILCSTQTLLASEEPVNTAGDLSLVMDDYLYT